MLPFVSPTGAIFDRNGRYRYSLWRVWNREADRVVFVMLNPSAADAERNDPTITRCIRFAQQWSYGGLEVVNLFAYRTASPIALRQTAEPVGADNDRYLLDAVNRGDRIVVAWGNGGCLNGRDRIVLDKLIGQQPLYCLGVNQSGQPRHPLYVRGDTPLTPFG